MTLPLISVLVAMWLVTLTLAWLCGGWNASRLDEASITASMRRAETAEQDWHASQTQMEEAIAERNDALDVLASMRDANDLLSQESTSRAAQVADRDEEIARLKSVIQQSDQDELQAAVNHAEAVYEVKTPKRSRAKSGKSSAVGSDDRA